MLVLPRSAHSHSKHLSPEMVLLRYSLNGLSVKILLTSVASAQLVLLGEA